jgi:YD repeat-containing protein
MTTYTYMPQVGTTSKCDERNQVTRYEYDNLLRLNLVRDNDNNILKTIEYNYKN